MVLGMLIPWPVVADPKDDFKAGIASADLGRWQDAVDHFRRAIDGDPTESADQVFLSGVFSRPYLPHFYLGDALANLGREAHCEQALLAWQESTRQGVVQGFRRQWKELEQGRDECLKRVLPSLESRLRQAITRAESGARGLPSAMPSAELGSRRSNIESELAGMKEMMEQAANSRDPGTRLDLLRRASTKVESVEAALARLLGALATHNSEALESARAAARRAIADAEGAREALGDLAESDPKRRELEHHFSNLATARQRMAAAGDVETLRQIRTSAKSAAHDFDEAREELAADRRAPLLAPGTAPIEVPAASPERGIGSDQGRAQPVRSSPARSPSATATPEAEDAEDPRIRAWTDRGRRLLADLGEPPDDRRLLRVQHSRLRALLDEREPGPGDAGPWLGRIQESVLALRLLAGIEAYFDGEHRRALTLMTSDLLNEAARVEERAGERSGRDKIRAQMFLFRAAAGLSLFRLGGEVEGDLQRKAAEDARQSRAISPDLDPSVEVFSPAFRAFFSAAGSGEGP